MTDTVFQKTSVKLIFFLFTALKLNSGLKGATTTTTPPPSPAKKNFRGKINKF
jgi:hypothetical protein